jgi:hypothetical protein
MLQKTGAVLVVKEVWVKLICINICSLKNEIYTKIIKKE